MPAKSEQLLTTEQIADELQIHIETVRRWLRSGKLQATMARRSSGYRISRHELNRFLAAERDLGPVTVAS